MLELNENRIVELNAFLDEQRDARNDSKKDFDTTIEHIINEIDQVKSTVIESNERHELEELEYAKMGMKNKKKSMVDERKEAEERKRMKRLAEEHQGMLGYYIRLIDYITIETLVNTLDKSVSKFYNEMITRKTRLFFTTVKYGKDSMQFNPDQDEIEEGIDNCIDSMIQEIGSCTRPLYQFDEQVAVEHLTHFPQVDEILSNSATFQQIRFCIKDKIQTDFQEARNYADNTFEKARHLNDYVEQWDFEDFKQKVTTVPLVKEELKKLKAWVMNDLVLHVPSVPINAFKCIFSIEGKVIKQHLQTSLNNAQMEIKDYLNYTAKSKAESANQELFEMNRRLTQNPTNLTDFVKYVEDVTQSEIRVKNLETVKAEVDEIAQTLKREKYNNDIQSTVLKIDEFSRNCENAKTNLSEATTYIQNSKPQMEDKLQKNIEKMQEALVTEITQKLDDPPYIDVDANPEEVLIELKRIENKLKKNQTNAEKYKHFQEIFDVPVTRFRELEDASNKFSQKLVLWQSKKEWEELSEKWLRDDFMSLNSQEIERRVNKYRQESLKLKQELGRYCKDGKDPVVEEFYNVVQDLKGKIWVITELVKPAMKTRHWNKVFELLENDIDYMEGRMFSFQDLIDWGVLVIKDKVEEISVTATEQFGLETTLEEIKKIWADFNFVLANYRETRNKYTISDIEPVLMQLEDHQVTVQTMLGNRFATDIRGLIEEWDDRLRLISYVIDEWLSCQKQWQYLENIFAAPDIQKQLPRENTLFQGVDKFWMDIMSRTQKNPKVLDACCTEGLLDRFKKNNIVLENIKKSLDEYLESKRGVFPRFYFLADEELLEILSQTRNPHAVQSHLRKCFDNMDRIIFTDEPESVDIIGMISGEKEQVMFSNKVQAVGNVEYWLTNIEEMMRASLYDLSKKALMLYPENGLDRRSWFFDNNLPAQSILLIDQIMWTKLGTDSITRVELGENDNAVQEFYQYILKQIGDMVEIVKGELDFQQRTLMTALIVLDVHGRDVVLQLSNTNIRSVHDFDWAKQLKYYWDPDIDNCVIRQTSAKFIYGYEYMGNSPRLVITPLTDKCYLTLTGALHLNYGGAPAGPAGTGKTETTKDLGKALAIQCVVFNCSDGLDVTIMSRFFSGLAQAGAWSCFDEFNRINIEVLSVIAEQILTIQQAIRGQVEEFDFFGRTLTLNCNFGVFITMNPGYAGRVELPDNLKALFRPVAMMIPDYGMIAEIILFSEGFGNAKNLSRKMVKLYSLASEQLSKQKHYDFGMRAVKSVLVMAGQLRRKNPELDEDVVLIRAMRDSNVPKFLEQDLPLFRGIIKDLFPTVQVPNIDYGDLERAIRNQLEILNYQGPNNFVLKIIQLLETMLVRHGNMIVGAAFTGKTTVYHILARALTQLHDEGNPDPAYQKIFYYPLNPKAITMGQLYGQTTITGDFTDGIVPFLVRSAKADETPSKKWIVFDGPVDADWIESMNTVLDDNKMLCLTSGERIKLPDTITMLFEVQDLDQASPATVSRCGMVFIDILHLGWKPVIDTWGVKYREKMGSHVESIIEKLVYQIERILPFIRSKCREEVPSVESNLVTSCLRFLDSLLYEEKISKKRPEDAETLINLYIIFAIIWSFGANINDQSRKVFDQKFRFELETLYNKFPEQGSVFDYCVDDDMCELVPWTNHVPNFNYSSKIPYFNILVPTVDTVRYKYLLEQLLKNDCNVLFLGNTGVGKSVIVHDYLMNSNKDQYIYTGINFSAQTSTHNLYDIFEDKLTARKRTLLGPPIGKKMIIFVDDVNMPQLDTFGAQPPVELLRQVLEIGFYDLKKFFLKKVTDTLFVSCCAPPGGGRNPITPRFFRHFNMIWQPQLSQSSMEAIFTAILRGFLDDSPEENFSDLAESIVKSSVECYVRITTELLPTPAKSHYTFNLRDLSKVIQGILQINYDNLTDSNLLIQLWLHEQCRVFRDRLIDDTDRNWFNETLGQKLQEYLYKVWEVSEWCDLIFGDFISGVAKQYNKIDYDQELLNKLNLSLEQYNAENANQMNLVFFKDAVQHLARISRIIRQPRGNALLVGVGGSGRQSLARLAISIAGNKAFSIEITRNYGIGAFHDDLKLLLMRAGAYDEQICFLFSDSQIVKESFLEDINNVLNTGEVPNLFEPPDLEEIIGLVRPKAKEAGKIETREVVLAHFVQLVRQNLHIVLAFSPVGEKFRIRCRQFPSIINCCTIDWYSAWPDEALLSVAQRFFEADEELQLGQIKDQLAYICMHIHSSVSIASDKFYNELRRKNYTTPTSYLELIRLYLNMLRYQQTILPEKINRYKVGLQRLNETNVVVADLQKELVELKPILAQSKIDNEVLMKQVQEKQSEVKIKEEAIASEEAECAATMKVVSDIKDDCQRELDEVLPVLAKANKALDALEKKDIVEVKSYTAAPPQVERVMNAVLILFKKKPSWSDAKKLLGDIDFLRKCQEYPKDDIKNDILRKLQSYVSDQDFNRQAVERVSLAAGSLCEWVLAMDKYAKIARNVEPKRQRLAQAESELKKAQELLFEKQSALKAVQDEAAELQATYESSVAKGKELEQKSDLTEARLVRAEKLVSGLSSESERWNMRAGELEGDLKNLIGNIIVSAGYISYLGPFTLTYRMELLDQWVKVTQKQAILVDPHFSLQKTLVDEVEVREWTLAGLPADQLSKDNAIMTTRCSRWPLIIDPQGQANAWIKKMDRETIKVIKLTDLNYAKTLETGIRFGNPILLENVEEVLDPGLDPVLQKQIVKRGGQQIIRLGDTDVPYSNDFRFYITTKLPNPHYLPEICIKVTIINFTVTLKGLEDQLLVEVVKVERPELEEQKNKLIIQISNDKDMLQELEDKILKLISEASDNLLDDEVLIETLGASKKTSEVIHVRMEEAETTAEQIDTARESYRIVAKRGSILYFVIADIGLVDPMYQYSLEFFNSLFKLRLNKSEKSEDLDRRLNILIEDITCSFFVNICRGLFEEHKLLYAFLNAIKIGIDSQQLNQAEWTFFLGGTEGRSGDAFNKDGLQLEPKIWNTILQLEKLHNNYLGLIDSFSQDTTKWKEIMNSDEPFKAMLPSPFNGLLSPFQQLLLVSILRNEKLVFGIKVFVDRTLGPEFTISPPFNLKAAYEDSNALSPIIFVLSPGADPISDLLKLAADKDMDGRLRMLSLGQGQGKRAEKLIENGRRNGDWVCLQNCHLAVSWMEDLERIQEQQVEGDTSPEYRLWLTSIPSNKFPVPVLQSGIKITNEPPKGLRANLRRTFQDISDSNYNGCAKSSEYKKLLFSLAFFHAVILERRKFGAIGWNKAYEWMTSDFVTCQSQLFMYLNDQPVVPYQTLNTIISVINYGGRVTDDKDVRLIKALLARYFSPEVMESKFRYTDGDTYYPPECDSVDAVIEYIQQLPPEEDPTVFGLHPNAEITFNQQTVNILRDTLILINPRGQGASGGKSSDEIASEIAKDIESKLPVVMDIVNEAHEVTFQKNEEGAINSLGVFLGQEIERFNILIKVMKKSLFEVQRAIKGEVVMGLDLEMLYNAFLIQKTPKMWEEKAYPCLKPLASWFKDLTKRVKFMRSWLAEGPRPSYWISAFFFPQGFMTASLQMYARKMQIPIDTLKFETQVTSQTNKQITSLPANGVNIYGTFMQGAAWDWKNTRIKESDPGILFCKIPVIHLEPVAVDKRPSQQVYKAPLYKTSLRWGELSTTGHSTNFVAYFSLPSIELPTHWVRNGVALLCQLDY